MKQEEKTEQMGSNKQISLKHKNERSWQKTNC